MMAKSVHFFFSVYSPQRKEEAKMLSISKSLLFVLYMLGNFAALEKFWVEINNN